ncbi:MAG: transferrin-binding protein-like solute binding protein [Conchiformibius sp.]|nr:transferrin-binding protein-like solute binding protein [Conchiformibius sp.]
MPLLPENNGFLNTRRITLASGREVDVTVCCSNLDYLKFGHLRKSRLDGDAEPDNGDTDDGDDSDNDDTDNGDDADTDNAGSDKDDADNGNDNGSNDKDNHTTVLNAKRPEEDSLPFSGSPYGSFLFIQGERTRTADVPQSGNARYAGTWDGFSMKQSVWRTLPGNGASSSKAQFNVDFGNKQLSGSLTEHNGVRPAFLIDAAIQGNGFNGSVRTHADGVNLDPGREGGSPILRFDDVPVSGGFYGPNAAEIGGSFFSDEHKTGAVFGGKRQVTTDTAR